MLDELPIELCLLCMKNLTTKDLLCCRVVSHRLKLCAENALKERYEELVVTGGYENINHFKFLCHLHCDVKAVRIESDPDTRFEKIAFETIVQLSSQHFTKLESLLIDNSNYIGSTENGENDLYLCNPSNSYLIADYFSSIKSLSLICVRLNDQNMALIFKHLVNLEHLALHYTDVSGICFVDLNDSITSIDWKVAFNFQTAREITFNGKGDKMRYFSYESYKDFNSDLDFIIPFVNEMKNLKTLKFDTDSKLNDSIFLNLSNVEELEFCVHAFDASCFIDPWILTKKLTFKTQLVTEDKIVTVLKHFPNIEELVIQVRLFDKFTLSLIQSLCYLRSLKSFTFVDTNYENERYMTLGGTERNALVEAISMMYNVTHFKIGLSTWGTTIRNLSELVEEIITIAIGRSSHEFHCEFVGTRMVHNNLPPNVIIEHVSNEDDVENDLENDVDEQD